jgi:predicted O-methyltransferase YrrM
MPTPSFPFSVFKGRPNLDQAFCTLFLKNRLQLPQLALSRYFPDFTAQAVRLHEVPRGDWSTPMNDVVMLLKIVLNAQPSRLMEVGSFRGYTALLIAQHMHEGATLVTVDRASEYGEAYRGSE